MTNDVTKVLKKLGIESDTGRYDNHFYIITIDGSNEYAKMYTKLCDNAVNTEYPNFGTNTTDNTVKVTNYFELDVDNISYNLFLIADFDADTYYLKIGEKK